MADSIKIPVELDVSALEQSLQSLKTRINNDFTDISNDITQNMQTAANNVSQSMQTAANNATQSMQTAANNINNSQQNIATQSTQTANNVQSAYQGASSSVAQNMQNASTRANNSQQTISNTANTVSGNVRSRFANAISNIRQRFADMATRVGSSLQNIGNKASEIGGKFTKSLTVPIVGAMTAGVKAAADLESALAKVNTIADTTSVSLETLKEDIVALSKETGIASDVLAEDVYNAISAGQKTEDAVNFVANSSKLAKAGFAESSQALDILTTIMNAYGLEAEEVSRVSDVLINTQNKGKVTVAELASSMGKIIPTANSMGINLEQVASGYAIMTAKGINAAETTTYMNSMFNEMGKSGSLANETIKKAFNGKSFQKLISEGKSVSDVLVGMEKYAKKNKLTLADMFGSAEAGKAALVLVNNEGKDFNNMLKDMGNVAGATDEAFAKVSATTKEQFTKALNDLKIGMTQLGEKLLPHLTKILEAVRKIIDRFNGLSSEQQGFIVKTALMIAAIGPLLSIFGKVATTVGKVSSFFGRFASVASTAATTTATTVASSAGGISTALGLAGRAVGLLTSPWIAVPAAVAAGTAFVINRTKKLKEELETNNAITRETILGIGEAYSALAEKSKTAAEKVSKANIEIFNGDVQLKADFQKSFESITLFMEEGVGNIQYNLDKIIGETELILPNLNIDEKKALASYYEELIYALTKAEEITIEEAEKYEKLLSEMFEFDINAKIELAKVELQINDIHEQINEALNENKGLFGFTIDFFGTKKKNAISGIKEALSEYKDIDKQYVNTKQVVEALSESLENNGLSAKKQKDVYLELGQTLATSFDTKQAVEIFQRISQEAGFTEDDIAQFIANTTANWSTLDAETKSKVAGMLGSMSEMSSKTKSFLNGDTQTLLAMMGENNEVWGAIIADTLQGSKDIDATIEQLKVNLAAGLKNIAPEQIPEATQWLSYLLGEIESQGGLTKDKVADITNYINDELGKIEGLESEVKVETTTNTEAIDALNAELAELTGKEVEAVALLDPIQFNQVYNELMHEITTVDTSDPTVKVDGNTGSAKAKLDEIKNQIKYIKDNQNLTVNVKKTITTTEKTVKAPANNAVDGAATKAVSRDLTIDTPTVLNNIGSTLASTFSNIASNTGDIATASAIISPTINKSTDNVDKKALTKLNNQVSKQNNTKPIVIETLVNLDGRTIARSISDKVDAFNGNTYYSKRRRYAY